MLFIGGGVRKAAIFSAMLAVLFLISSTTPTVIHLNEGNINENPVADAGPDQTVKLGDTVYLNGSKSYDPDNTAGWFTMAPMPTARRGAAVATVGGKIYAIGGQIREEAPWISLNVTEEYDPRTNTWRERAPMPTARGLMMAGVIDGKIYVVGGAVEYEAPLDVNEVYDPVTDTWEKKRPTPMGGVFRVGVAYNMVYVTDGHWNFEYDPKIDEWETKELFPQRTNDPALASLNNTIYAFGGSHPGYANATFAYDPLSDSWSERQPMPTSRVNTPAVAMGSKIYVIGGDIGGDNTVTGANEEYDPLTDSWEIKEPMPTPRDELGLASTGNAIYAIGGSSYMWEVQYDVNEKYSFDLEYDWDFGDGSPHGLGVNTTHIYEKEGIYTVTLTVTDPAGAQGTDTCIVTVTSEKLNATIDFDPDTLSLKSKGRWVTVYIELPEGYDVEEIDARTVLLEDTLSPVLTQKYGFVASFESYIVDHDGDGIMERMLKFNRSEVQGIVSPGIHNFKVNGELRSGTEFEGYSDPIKVIDPIGWQLHTQNPANHEQWDS